jgi:hypothetical protein
VRESKLLSSTLQDFPAKKKMANEKENEKENENEKKNEKENEKEK